MLKKSLLLLCSVGGRQKLKSNETRYMQENSAVLVNVESIEEFNILTDYGNHQY